MARGLATAAETALKAASPAAAAVPAADGMAGGRAVAGGDCRPDGAGYPGCPGRGAGGWRGAVAGHGLVAVADDLPAGAVRPGSPRGRGVVAGGRAGRDSLPAARRGSSRVSEGSATAGTAAAGAGEPVAGAGAPGGGSSASARRSSKWSRWAAGARPWFKSPPVGPSRERGSPLGGSTGVPGWAAAAGARRAAVAAADRAVAFAGKAGRRTVVGRLHGAAVGHDRLGAIEFENLLHGDGLALAVVVLHQHELREDLAVDDPGVALLGADAGVAFGQFLRGVPRRSDLRSAGST